MTDEQRSLVSYVREVCSEALGPSDLRQTRVLYASWYRAGVLAAARASNAPADFIDAVEAIPDPIEQ